MSTVGFPEHRVLHALRCMGSSSVPRVAAASGFGAAVVEGALQSLEGRGLVSNQAGDFGGWAVTEAGKGADAAWLADERKASGPAISRALEAFLALNASLLEVCHDWQMRTAGSTPVFNDHSDPDHDAAVIDRLMRIDEMAQRLLAELGSEVIRFDLYRRRLTSALDRVLAGERTAFTDDVESYHNVWFQLHEDLLASMGSPRF